MNNKYAFFSYGAWSFDGNPLDIPLKVWVEILYEFAKGFFKDRRYSEPFS